MHLNVVEKLDGGEDDNAASRRVRELRALASIVDFAIYTAATTDSDEALVYLRTVADIVKADLSRA